MQFFRKYHQYALLDMEQKGVEKKCGIIYLFLLKKVNHSFNLNPKLNFQEKLTIPAKFAVYNFMVNSDSAWLLLDKAIYVNFSVYVIM